MNLQNLIIPELWSAISNTYEAGNYTHAIVDAIHVLSQTLREKSGLNGDGHRLVGAALGGESPVLRINKFQTDTERNIQKGFEQMLRGIYQGIRNPRSHEHFADSKKDADAIIYFINYLLGVLEESQQPFTTDGFLNRVFDEHFVQSSRYVEILVSEVPSRKRLDVLIEIYRKKQEGNGENVASVVMEFLKHLEPDQVSQFLSVVNEELRTTNDTTDIRLTLQLLPEGLWTRLDESARLRVENILLKSIKKGKIDPDGNLIGGALGTWARDFLPYFALKKSAAQIILNKLTDDYSSQRYVFDYFLYKLPSLFDTTYYRTLSIKAISDAINMDLTDSLVEDLRAAFPSFPEDWKTHVCQALPDLILVSEEDDIPF